MASEHNSSRLVLHEMTPTTISLGLMPSTLPSTPFVPPLRSDYDILFQPLYDELLTPSPSVDHLTPKVIAPIAKVVAPEPAASTGLPSITTVDQDEPSPSNSQTKPKTQSPIIPNDVEEYNHDLDIVYMNINSLFSILIPGAPFDQYLSTDIIHSIVHPDHQISIYNSIWTKDHPLENIIDKLARPVSTRLQLHEQALFYYYDAFITSVEPKMYKDALTQTCWIEAIQPDRFVDPDNPNHVYKLKKALYGLKQAPCAWYDMLSLFLISQDFFKGSVDPTLFICRDGSKILLDSSIALTAFADADHASCQDIRRSKYGSMKFMGDRLATATYQKHHIKFNLKRKSYSFDLETFRYMFQICQKIHGQKFVDPPFEEEILAFLRNLRYPGNIKTLSEVKKLKFYLNHGGHSEQASTNVSVKNVDYVYLLWKDLVYQIENKVSKRNKDMYYPRFTKIIINHFKSQDLSIPRRKKVDWHMASDNLILTTMRFIPQHKVVQTYGAILPDNLTNQSMKESEAYKTYYAFATGKAISKPKYKSSDDEDDDDDETSVSKDKDDDDQEDGDDQDNDDQDNDDDQGDDDDEQTDSDNDGDDFFPPKFFPHDEEDSFDPRVQTPFHVGSTDDKDDDKEI
uniref:Putative Gag-Pol polyprotein n=1 Tax=Tanacetum cinerariifolium TaxID=118510 RepID=A0A6L2KHD5_TANCI|nr:putative Gag-Pol polyprotein [Tanacetum cinerariifolium]